VFGSEQSAAPFLYYSFSSAQYPALSAGGMVQTIVKEYP